MSSDRLSEACSELVADLNILLARVVDRALTLPETNNLTLTGGLAGKLLLLNSLSSYSEIKLEEKLNSQVLDKVFATIPHQALDHSLASGIAGIGWALEETGVNTEEDQCIEIDECLIELLSVDHWQGEYELLYGLVGVGVYALSRMGQLSGRKLCSLVVNHLQALAVESETQMFWRTPTGSVFIRDNVPQPQIDLGVAHGNLGVLGLLQKLVEVEFEVEQTRPMLTKVLNFYSTITKGHESYLPSHLGGEHKSLLGWCYGDLTSALLIIKSAKVLDSEAFYQFGIEVAQATLARKAEFEGLRDAALCHGAAGIALIYQRLFQETQIQAFNERRDYWCRKLLEQAEAEPELTGLMAKHKQTAEPFPGEGLLSGYAGIALSILSIVSPDCIGWDEFLLLS